LWAITRSRRRWAFAPISELQIFGGSMAEALMQDQALPIIAP
jgi:hypothetical protein